MKDGRGRRFVGESRCKQRINFVFFFFSTNNDNGLRLSARLVARYSERVAFLDRRIRHQLESASHWPDVKRATLVPMNPDQPREARFDILRRWAPHNAVFPNNIMAGLIEGAV